MVVEKPEVAVQPHVDTGGLDHRQVERVEADGVVLAHVRASKSPRPGSLVRFADAFDAEVLGRAGDDGSLFRLRFPDDPYRLLERHGHVPLPPYIERADGGDDVARYQTVFAERPGAVAAPTAGGAGVLPAVLVSLGVTALPMELLYRDTTIMVGLVYTSMLFMVVPLISALESLDDTLIEAAYDLGGNGPSILRQIVIPHAAPGILAGCIVVFMLTLGNYLTPTLLGGKNSLWFTEQIYTQFITRFNWEQGAAFGFLLLGLSTAIVWLGLKLTGQKFGEVMKRT